MVNDEMGKESTPNEALMKIQARKQSSNKAITPPRHSARLSPVKKKSSGYSSSSPGNSKKKAPPGPKTKKRGTKKKNSG